MKLKYYFQSVNGDFNLLKGDSLQVLKQIPDSSVDMVFADPPYFLSNGGVTCQAGRMVSVDKGKWDESQGVELDHEFHIAWLQECQRILAPHGTIWVSGTRHNVFSVGFAMQKLGLKLLNDIVWHKRNPPPNLSCRYFTHATETILWAGKTQKAKHMFNYPIMKEANGGKQMQNVWDILAPRKSEKRFGKHPTQKPEELLERIVLASTMEGALVVDPFSGSGTTGVAATRLGRRFIGIELEQEYLDLSVKRYRFDVEPQIERRIHTLEPAVITA